MELLKKSIRFRWTRIIAILVIVLIAGTVLTIAGAVCYWNYSLGSTNTLDTERGGFGFGWGPTNVGGTPSVALNISPEPNNDSYINIGLSDNFDSNQTFVFAFLFPFTVGPWFSQGGNGGNWSYHNVGDNGSAVYFVESKPNNSVSAVLVSTSVAFYGMGMPHVFDHGRNTVFFSLAAEAPLATYKFIQGIYPYFGTDDQAPLDLSIYVPASDIVTSSVPTYQTIVPYYYWRLPQPVEEVRYIVNGSTTLTMSYEDPNSVSWYSSLQTFGLFFLGVGIPSIIASPAEIYREWKNV